MDTLKTCFKLSCITFSGILLFLMGSYIFIIPDVSELIHAADDNQMMVQQFYTNNDHTCTLEEIPRLMVYAFITSEDGDFYVHYGIDLMALMRATKTLITTGKKSEGGSTITMQVARNFYLHKRKTFLRKYREILLALKLERNFSKQQILEFYLNKIYFGNNQYGVKDASKYYYGKTLDELTLAQIAMIAIIPRAPSNDNPLDNPALSLKRRNHLLQKMLHVGQISIEEYTKAFKEPLTAAPH